jgi:hypothetical protein
MFAELLVDNTIHMKSDVSVVVLQQFTLSLSSSIMNS